MLLYRLFSFVLLFCCVYTSMAQDGCVVKGDFYIYKQREIDRFATDYPGCTSISGDLVIDESYQGVILNLEGLSQLEKVGGTIRIENNLVLSSLDGLENIDTIGGSLSIEGNQALADIKGITSLKELMYGLNIADQPNLHHIDTFLFLDTIYALSIQNIPNLKDLSCLSHLQRIRGSCTIADNEGLENLEGLDHLESVGSSMVLEANHNMLNLEGLENLRHSGWLTIRYQPMIQDLTGLDSLDWIHGLHLEQNAQLTSLQQLEHLNADSLTYINIQDNPLLSQCHMLPICQAFHHTEEYPEIENNGSGCNTPLDFIHGCGFNGSCPQDVVLQTQADVDRFAEVYPGCDSIYGDLNIKSDSISNLHGLAHISYIGGKLYIYSNDELTSLDGLEQVSWIGGAIEILYNDRLQSITGLSGLQEIQNGFNFRGNDSIALLPDMELFNVINGDLFIAYNSSLHNISALHNLRYVGGDLFIINNPALLSLTGLENLESVAGDLYIEDLNIEDITPLGNLDTIHNQLVIGGCPLLPDLSGLENLRSLKSLHVSYNEGLLDLNGLNALSALSGYVDISNNAALISISGLPALQQVDGKITIKNNLSLQDLSAFHQLTSVNGITLENNPQLTSLEGFEELQVITGDLILKSMHGLMSLTGLHQLHTIQGYLEASSNDFLLSLDGLDQLKYIAGKLQLKDNKLLSSLSGLDALDSIGGNLVLENCGLTTLDDFIQLKSIKGSLTIFKNPKLTLVSGFEQVTKLGGLYVLSNPALTTLYGLSALSSLTGIMEIRNNMVLTHLSALDKLIETDTAIRIRTNPKLARIDFLNHLQSVGSLEVYENPVDTLYCRSLKQVSRNLEIQFCTKLKGIYMDSLTRIGNDFSIVGNYSLVQLGSFNSLVETGGEIRINSNSSLVDIEALSALQRFNGRLRIDDNRDLATIEGLRNVERSSFYVPDNLTNQDLFTISDNGDLTACAIPAICEILGDPSTSYYLKSNHTGCNNSTEVQAQCGLPNSCLADSIIFDSQASIDDFPSNYPGCSFVTGKLIIEESQSGDILNLDSLSAITRIGGDLVIRNNVQLTELNGLSMLKELGGSLWVHHNASLNSLMALQYLTPHEDRVEGTDRKEFVITDNPNLSSCSIPFVCNTLTDPYRVYALSENKTGCSAVTEVQEFCDYPTECELGYVSSQQWLNHFRIRYPKCKHLTDYLQVSYSISDLSPLSLIESVDGAIYLTNLEILSSLDGLDNLLSLNGPLIIKSNGRLEDISALRLLDPTTLRKNINHFELSGNPSLSACAIQSVCQIVENPELTTKISGNGFRCETRDELLKNCTVGILTPDENLEIMIYPNPANDQIHITSLTDLHQEIIAVTIVDINGIIRTTSTFTSSLDVSHLSPGLYVIVLQSREHGLLAHRFLIAK